MRIIAAIVLVAVLAVGGGFIATTAYQAGLSHRGHHGRRRRRHRRHAGRRPRLRLRLRLRRRFGLGFGFFGFLGTLLLPVHRLRPDPRRLLGRPRRRGWGGRDPAGRGGWDPGGPATTTARSKFHGTFDDWHRQAHARTRPRPAADRRPTATPPVGLTRLPSPPTRPRASSPGALHSPSPYDGHACAPSSSSMTSHGSSSWHATTSSTPASRC